MKTYRSRRLAAMLALPLLAGYAGLARADTPTQTGIKAAYNELWPGNFYQDGRLFVNNSSGGISEIPFTAYQSDSNAQNTQYIFVDDVHGLIARGDLPPLAPADSMAAVEAGIQILGLRDIPEASIAQSMTADWLHDFTVDTTSSVSESEPQQRTTSWGRVKELYK